MTRFDLDDDFDDDLEEDDDELDDEDRDDGRRRPGRPMAQRGASNMDVKSSRDAAQLKVAAAPAVPERRGVAWIGELVRIEGRVVSTQDLTIDGQVDGSIEVGDHNLAIGVGAGIKAALVAKTITISGTVTGNITAIEKLDLRSTGSVDGDIVTPSLLMADGAVVTGKVDVRGHRPTSPGR